ncbi:MAG: hypothetical protein HQ518_07830 [Rhodopirellula sp.]|nr:hypothetical protein [Rhodopirellula sp.]
MTAIADCPPLEADDGTGRRLVTAVFRHVADNVIDVSIEGESELIGCTSNHPFWSHDRQEFVEAGTLEIGERVLSDDGTPRAITRITPHRGPPVVVYNFEVDIEHVYVVGESGLLVHNSCRHNGPNNFKKNNPEFIGTHEIHHSVEWNVLKRYPGTFTPDELNLEKMMRPIQKGQLLLAACPDTHSDLVFVGEMLYSGFS